METKKACELWCDIDDYIREHRDELTECQYKTLCLAMKILIYFDIRSKE